MKTLGRTMIRVYWHNTGLPKEPEEKNRHEKMARHCGSNQSIYAGAVRASSMIIDHDRIGLSLSVYQRESIQNTATRAAFVRVEALVLIYYVWWLLSLSQRSIFRIPQNHALAVPVYLFEWCCCVCVVVLCGVPFYGNKKRTTLAIHCIA